MQDVGGSETSGLESEGIILAAGFSSRCDRYKLALPLGDKTVIECSLEGMYDSVQRILVVVGWQEDIVRAILSPADRNPYPKVEFVRNDDVAAGMFYSVRLGAAQVRAAHFFMQPSDIPLIRPEVYRQLLKALKQSEEEDGYSIAIPTYHGRKGHPVLMSSALIPDLLSMPQDSTMRNLIQDRGFLAVPVEDEGILLDIDTLDDYREIAKRYSALSSKE